MQVCDCIHSYCVGFGFAGTDMMFAFKEVLWDFLQSHGYVFL